MVVNEAGMRNDQKSDAFADPALDFFVGRKIDRQHKCELNFEAAGRFEGIVKRIPNFPLIVELVFLLVFVVVRSTCCFMIDH